MILRTIRQFANGEREERAINTDARRGRYLLGALAAYPHINKSNVKNGFQYETTSIYTSGRGHCVTTVTLERGFV